MKISLITPTYNESKTIEATLRQFTDIRGADFEVIVSDNGSDDDTVAQARELADHVVELPEELRELRSTIGASRNRGAAVATGDVLWFIDADVRVADVAGMAAAIRAEFADTDIVAATAPLRIYAGEERFADRFWLGFMARYTWFLNSVVRTGGAPGDCQLIRRATFESLGGFDDTMPTAEDFELFARLVKQGRVRMLWNWQVHMSPRRFHRDGWAKVLWLWGRNWFVQVLLGRKSTETWEARR